MEQLNSGHGGYRVRTRARLVASPLGGRRTRRLLPMVDARGPGETDITDRKGKAMETHANEWEYPTPTDCTPKDEK